MTIEGHGSTIFRSTTANTPAFRILAVHPAAFLALPKTTLKQRCLSEDSHSHNLIGIRHCGSPN